MRNKGRPTICTGRLILPFSFLLSFRPYFPLRPPWSTSSPSGSLLCMRCARHNFLFHQPIRLDEWEGHSQGEVGDHSAHSVKVDPFVPIPLTSPRTPNHWSIATLVKQPPTPPQISPLPALSSSKRRWSSCRPPVTVRGELGDALGGVRGVLVGFGDVWRAWWGC